MKKIFKNPWLLILVYVILLLIGGTYMLLKPVKIADKTFILKEQQETKARLNKNKGKTEKPFQSESDAPVKKKV